MRKKVFLSCLLLFFIFTGCESDNASDQNVGWNPETKVYYIQYQVALVYGQRVAVSYLNEEGKFASVHTGNTGGQFVRTVGPVSKGFTAIVKADADFSTDIGLSIHCCKGSEPFVQKASGTNRIHWTID